MTTEEPERAARELSRRSGSTRGTPPSGSPSSSCRRRDEAAPRAISPRSAIRTSTRSSPTSTRTCCASRTSSSMLRAQPGRVTRLQALQKEYFRQITRGRIDADYVESRLRVGNTHQQIGLRPEWYIGGFGLPAALATSTRSTGRAATPDGLAAGGRGADQGGLPRHVAGARHVHPGRLRRPRVRRAHAAGDRDRRGGAARQAGDRAPQGRPHQHGRPRPEEPGERHRHAGAARAAQERRRCPRRTSATCGRSSAPAAR